MEVAAQDFKGQWYNMKAWFRADDTKRSFQWVWIPDNQQGAKADTSSWEQSGAGKVQSPGSGYNPIPNEIWSAAVLQIIIAEKQ